MEDNNKKTLILSIVGILVLVIAVVGVSFAMYSFTGTGTKENVIQTGTVTMSFDPDNNFTVSNKYPMSDATGIAQTDSKATFGVKAVWGTSTMTINYDLGITNIQAGPTLTAEYIKVALLSSDGTVLVGGGEGTKTLTSGVKISDLAGVAGPNGLITAYGLTGGKFTTSDTTDTYTILAYVSDDYNLPTDTDNTTTDNEGTVDRNLTSKKTTKSETFSFKVGVKAAQA